MSARKVRVVWSDDGGGRRGAERAEAVATIEAALDVLLDPKKMRILRGPYLFNLLENQLPLVLANVGKYARVRIEQSYSRTKRDSGEEERAE